MLRTWLRRLGYLLFLIVWLLVMAFPAFAFFLATQGEINLGQDAQNHVRFFLVQEEEAGGVGIEWTRPFSKSEVNQNCAKTSIRYILWTGNNSEQNVTYCQCFDAAGETLPVEQNSCEN